MIDAAAVAQRVDDLRRQIAGLTDRRVELVAVTKTFGIDAVHAALAAGADGIGENYAQELSDKHDQLADDGSRAVPWHFIGHLQRNKVKVLAGVVTLWQTVDRLELVRELAHRVPGAAVLVQVNTTDEPQKGGCAPGELAALVAAARGEGLELRGLMTIGRIGDADATRRAYRSLRALADEHGLGTCSMGMSDDYRIALEEGSTMVRIGSRLFGPRAPRA